ncbi:MAG: cobalamin biosynthesis protein [Alphaproteobacteria bacterium]
MTGRSLALGLGTHRDATVEEALALARAVLAEAGQPDSAVAVIATLDTKAGAETVAALATALGVPVRSYPAARLEEETPRLASPSERVFRAVGCHGVAEAAALAAAGPAAALLVPKRRSARATCALAGPGGAA